MAVPPSLAQIAGSSVELYEAYFQQEDKAKNNAIGALDAANFLKKSMLSDNVLSRVWDLSDPTGRGFLDKRGFFIALKLVSLAQNDHEVSLKEITKETPPPKMGDPPVMPPQQEWGIKLSERLKFEQLFDSLGPVNGLLPGNKVKPVMLNSKLPLETLGQVWDLSDMDKDGLLDRDEFILAMHLIYQALENHPVPTALPPELIPASKRSSLSIIADSTSSSISPSHTIDAKNPEVTWVVSTADKARYDIMFQKADLDNDGYVNGAEIKDSFLQSGLPQPVLAHIWNLCDMNQTGKLNREQFALAMYLVQRKVDGHEIEQKLNEEMIPPSMRQRTNSTGDITTSNPELDLITKEIDELLNEKKLLEKDVAQKNTEIVLKKGDLTTLQSELETLAAAVKQLNLQKGEAQKRLDELDSQKSSLDLSMRELHSQLEQENNEVMKLKEQADEQERSIAEQGEQLNNKRQQLQELRLQETQLEKEIENGRNQLNLLNKSAQESQLQITQAKNKILQIQEQHRRMNDAINKCDEQINGDIINESVDLQLSPPSITDEEINRLTTLSSTGDDSLSGRDDPFNAKDPFVNGFAQDPFSGEDPFKSDPFSHGNPSETSLEDPFGGHDPFDDAFVQPNDPFASAGATSGKGDPFDPFGLRKEDATKVENGDPFGSDPFAPFPTSASPPPVAPRSDSPTPALPPKKSRQPPPRPAPPKSSGVRAPRAAPPAPDPFARDSNQTSLPFPNDPFDPFNNKDPFVGNQGGNGDHFADFANFDKCGSGWGVSEDDQLAWATNDSLRMEQERRREDADLELALVLSRNESGTQ